ncbi:AAA family ATPase [Streptomyces sp. NPDC047043]|uniref:ATP-binding protein n=1 Tax=Streptomyces sp. NPDC047043 TaxID=3154497 RepID=UPI0033D61621
MNQRRQSSGHGHTVGLLGRGAECTRLDEMIIGVRAGESRVLVVRGPPGVGKSALLEYAEDAVTGGRVLRASGVESEMELAFATLHQLCSPLLVGLRSLPVPQRAALETVFGMREGAPPDRFLVGLAVLSLLSGASEERPLLCVVDDAQWLDRASAQVLGFVARRLLAEPIGFLFGTRRPEAELGGLPELEVTGLTDADAHALLNSATHARLDQPIRDRIVAETKGNPLALLELPRGLSMTRMAGGLGLLNADTLPGHVEQSFLSRIQELPEQTRLLLLIAAAEPVGDPDLMHRAAERLGVTLATALAGGTDGLLTIDERVTFRHPLVRSAVYRAAEAKDRRAVHLALAEVTDPQVDPDRRAWHLASAAAGPDEAVAAELEQSAGRAQARGGLAAAAAFLQRSVAMSEDPARRADRALAAAGAGLQAGDFQAAHRCLDTAERDARDEWGRTRTQLVRGQLAFASGMAGDAPPLLLDAAQRLEAFDMDLARETYLTAWGAAVFAADADSQLRISRAIASLPRPQGEPRLIDQLLSGYGLLVAGDRAAAVSVLQEAVPALARMASQDFLRWGWIVVGLGTSLWDEGIIRSMFARGVRLTRDTGALADLTVYLTSLAGSTAWAGDFAGAAALVAEAELFAAATGSPMAPTGALRLESLRGREEEASALIGAVIEQTRAGGQSLGLGVAQWSAAVLYNGLAKYEQAALAGRAASEIHEPWISTYALAELVEAAVRISDEDLARGALERMVDAMEACTTDWALGTSARTRALLSDAAHADELFREAVERLGRTQLRPELGRAHLLYGEWLRRERRRGEARQHLRTAYEMFTSIGMEAFAERARRELLATGETVRKRTVEASSSAELTPQERQIALLVRDGLSNPEVGARLFLSPRTVEWHLRKIFTKLSITSRRQLREVMPRGEYESTPGKELTG